MINSKCIKFIWHSRKTEQICFCLTLLILLIWQKFGVHQGLLKMWLRSMEYLWLPTTGTPPLFVDVCVGGICKGPFCNYLNTYGQFCSPLQAPLYQMHDTCVSLMPEEKYIHVRYSILISLWTLFAPPSYTPQLTTRCDNFLPYLGHGHYTPRILDTNSLY